MGRLVSFLCISLVFAGCGRTAATSEVQFDAAYSIPLDGHIRGGTMLTESTNVTTVKNQILSQLYYTVGQLNAVYGVSDMSRAVINIDRIEPSAEHPGLNLATFRASLFVSWDRQRAMPLSLELTMPAQGSSHGIDEFMGVFAENCRDDFSHEPAAGNFWYYYRPAAPGCLLRDVNYTPSTRIVTKYAMTFTPSNEQTNGKSPEYGKVWEDGRLVVTAVFGKNDPAEDPRYDAGVSAFNALYSNLIYMYGRPATIDVEVPAGSQPGPAIDRLVMTFATTAGTLDVGLLLVDGIRSMTPDQTEFYNRRTGNSDLVSYNGHSGLGANIRALANLGSFRAGQYQIFFVNGCDTFAYVDNALRDAHHAVNPSATPDKYIDMITNSMPSYFHQNAPGNVTLISALISQTQTYRQILGAIDRTQRAVVTGEQDNTWPRPFE
jgi:hypothetical protein